MKQLLLITYWLITSQLYSQGPEFIETTFEMPKKQSLLYQSNLDDHITVRMVQGKFDGEYYKAVQVLKDGQISNSQKIQQPKELFFQHNNGLLVVVHNYMHEKGVSPKISSIYIDQAGTIHPAETLFTSSDIASGESNTYGTRDVNLIGETSADGEYFLLYDVVDDRDKKTYMFEFAVLNSSGKLVRTGSYNFPNNGRYHLFRPKMLNNGDILLLADTYDLSADFIKKNGGSYAGTIVQINDKKSDFEDLLDDKNTLVDFAEISLNGENFILQPEFSRETGLVFVTKKIDWQSKTLRKVDRKELPSELYDRDDNTKADSEFKTGYKDFKAVGNYKLANGNLVVLLERMTVVPYVYENKEQPIYYYDELYMIEIDEKANILFIDKIEKKHTQRIYNKFIGTLVKVQENTIYFYFNDKTMFYKKGQFQGVDSYVYPESVSGSTPTFVTVNFETHQTKRENIEPPSGEGTRIVTSTNFSSKNSSYVTVEDKSRKRRSYTLRFK